MTFTPLVPYPTNESHGIVFRKSVALGIALACTPFAVAQAQSIRGTVARPTDGGPLAGVVVLLMNSGDTTVARALTNERGEYHIVAPRAGRYRERTLRIGYRPATSEGFDLAVGPEAVHRIALMSVALALDTVRVVSASRCDVRADTATSTFAIWEQVRAALTATQLSGERAYAARVVTYDRTLEADGRRVRSQEFTLNRNFSAGPWKSQTSAQLHENGYVVDEADGGTTYFAPGLDVLLSDSFLDDHCFHLATGADPRQIGLDFEPSRGRGSVPDIRGTIWLDRLTSQLERLDFRFANVSREREDAGAGGNLAFVRMSNGAWAISRWAIRMPVLERKEVGGFGVARGTELRLAEIKVAGGELALMLRGRDTLWARAPLTLTGTTVDSATGNALSGAHVAVLGTVSETTTDEQGRFSLPGLLPGTYAAEVRTASLDAIGVVVQREFTFTDVAEGIRIAVPSAGQLATSVCGVARGSDAGVMTGSVRIRGDTVKPAGVEVLAEWIASAHDGNSTANGQMRFSRTRTDATGRFWLCGIPQQKDIALRIASDTLFAAAVPARIGDDIVVRIDITADHASAKEAAFSGIVIRDSTNAALSDVEVALTDLKLSTRTDAQGLFRFSRVPAGTHSLAVRRVGYGPLETSVELVSRASVYKRIVLSRMSQLDSIRVVATSERLGAGLAGFSERSRLGFGKFIAPDVMRANEHRKVQDLLTAFPGVNVLSRNQCHMLSRRQGDNPCAQLSPSGHFAASTRISHISPCFMDVLLDGVKVGKGGTGDWTTAYDLDMLPVSGLEAIEVYRSAAEVPTLYGGPTAQCGVILLWSRNSGGS